MTYNKVFEFSVTVRGYYYYRSFWIRQKDQILECFFDDALQSKYAKLEMKMQLVIFLQKYLAWIGDSLSVLS